MTLGIPDLRLPHEETPEAEARLVQQLLEAYETSDFRDLALLRVQARPTTEQRKQKFADYNLMIRERSTRFHTMFTQRLEETWCIADRRVALDIGCGIGPGILALAQEFDLVVGLDVHLSALLVAKKMVESEGLENVLLVQGSALALPFVEKQFDYTIAINVLEHVFKPDIMLREVYRTLSSGGIFSGDSRNRYDPFFPEPHVGLRWLGFLPRELMEPYVKWRMNVNYDHTFLLSYWDLKNAATKQFGSEWRVVLPDVAAYGVKSPIIRHLVELAHQYETIEAGTRHLSPTHLLFARRRGIND
ncbi:MAG: methyltransferase domain-containing protein [Chloroflexota bacterium]